jgi:pSer/pThr/pTyr-binding forkhead associated (FHA) protein
MSDKSVLPQKDHFLIVEDDKGRKQVLLVEPSYSIGRSPNCDICLRSQFVSRHHATLIRRRRDDGQSYYQIVDGDIEGRSSANGLVINGRKTTEQELKHGDIVVFGPQVLATYQYRQRDKFPTMPSNDPFDITLIDPAMMMAEEEDETELRPRTFRREL